jgi:hypothetical protein
MEDGCFDTLSEVIRKEEESAGEEIRRLVDMLSLVVDSSLVPPDVDRKARDLLKNYM